MARLDALEAIVLMASDEPEIDPANPIFAPFDRVTWPAYLKMRGASDAAV